MSALLQRMMGYMDAAGDPAAGGGGAPAAAPATDPAATGGAPAAEPAAPATDPAAPAGETAEAKATREAAEAIAKAAENAPESYADFTPPEGVELDPTIIDAFKPVAKELNLSQAKAQALIDKLTPIITQQSQAAVDTLHAQATAEWANTAKADPEIGGDRLDENLAKSRQLVEKLAPPEFVKFLNESGLGNHPEMIRMFSRLSPLVMQDGTLIRDGGSLPQDDLAKRLYSNTNLNQQ